MILSFRTDMSGQTVQTQRSSLIRVFTVCNSRCIFWMHYSKEKPSCSTFMVITANFRVSEILGFLRYINSLLYHSLVFVIYQHLDGRFTWKTIDVSWSVLFKLRMFIHVSACRNHTRGIWNALSTVQYLSNRLTNPFMFGIILNSYLCSMLRNKFEMESV